MFTKFRVMMPLVLIALVVPSARGQHKHGDEKKGEEHGKPAVFTMPTSYKAAVQEIEHRLHEIDELIEAKKLDKVHAEADVIQKVAKQVGQLALNEGSGVPKEAVKDVNVAGKDLAAKFDAIDKARDSNDLAGTKKIYEEMVKTAAVLGRYAGPQTYAEAVAEIQHGLDEMAEYIEAKKLDKVHAEADEIQEAAKMIGQLAAKEGSGVPKEAVKDVSAAGDDLAAKCEGIEKPCQSGDQAGTKKIYDEMVRAGTTLQKYAAATYQCPMKCEGEKTYAQAGKCPKCGMDLKRK